MSRRPALPILLTAACLCAGAARADDLQAWPTVLAVGKIRSDGLAFHAEGQLRQNDDIGRVLVKTARLGVGKVWDDGHSVYGGWAWFQTDPLGRASTDEHRIWEQLGYTILNRGRLNLTGRMRFEQRFREDAPDTAFRMRQMIRAQYLIGAADGPSLVASSEFFTEAADTRWGVKARAYDQVRNFAGVRVPVARKLAVEAGYLGQTLNGAGRGGTNHILSVTAAFAW